MSIYRVDLHAKSGSGADEVFSYATRAYQTSPSGSPANTFYEGRVQQPGLFRRDMFGEGRLFGGLVVNSGACVLDNGDGGLDFMKDYAFDGLDFYIWQVEPDDPDNPVQVFEGVLEQPIITEETVTFMVRDYNHKLDVLLQDNRYGGTNSLPAGVDGTADDIAGRPKPILVGGCYNFEPVCVNTSKLIYQFDSFYAGATLYVYDSRAQLTLGTAYTDQADMEANAPASGSVRFWTAGGMFRIGARPVGRITCTGTVMPPGGSPYLSEVVEAILAFVYSGDFEAQMATTIGTGVYVLQEATVLNVLNEVLEGTSAFLTYGPSPTGAYSGNGYFLSQLTDPASLPYTPLADILELDETNILKGSIEPVIPNEVTRGLPVWRVNLSADRNYTVMTQNEIAGTVSQADVTRWGLEYRVSSVEDVLVKTVWPSAPELSLRSNLAGYGATTAQHYMDLHGVKRDIYRLKVPMEVARDVPAVSGSDRYSLQLQSRVSITYPRFGLDSGKLFLVIGMVEDYKEETVELIVWG